jgi:hypothetical protein
MVLNRSTHKTCGTDCSTAGIHRNSTLHYNTGKLPFNYMGLQLAVITHNSKAGQAHNLIFYMLPPNKPTITVWTFGMKRLDALGSLKHVPFDTNRLYQFITPHSILTAAQLTKGSNKTCENYMIISTNIQYLIINIRNLISPQTLQ